MKLIDNWKQSLKFFSVQANVLNTSFLTGWALLPAKFQDAIPMPMVVGIAISLVILSTIGRLVKQDSVDK